jgi:TetR/AcrR family transcriptional regulator
MKKYMHVNEKSFEKKQELIEAALDEFTRNNFEEASLNTIIKQAGISKGSFYYHFENKEALYVYLLKHAFNAKWAFIQQKSNEYPEKLKNADFYEKIKIQARLGADFAIAHPRYYHLSRMFSSEKGHAIYDVVLKALESQSENKLKEMITTAKKDGSIRESFSEDFVYKFLGHILANFNEIFNSPVDSELENLIVNLNDFVDFLKYGLSR